jgi:hypothetical protein
MPYTKTEILKAGELAEIDKQSMKLIITHLNDAKAFYAKPTAPYPAKEFLDLYFDFYKQALKDEAAEPKISPSDARSAKLIYDYLYKIVRAKKPNATQQDVISAWQMILAYYPMEDRFYKCQLNLFQIERNLNNLIALVRQQYGKSTGQTSAHGIAKIIAERNYGI